MQDAEPVIGGAMHTPSVREYEVPSGHKDSCSGWARAKFGSKGWPTLVTRFSAGATQVVLL